ncbi:UrcA family protein [Erythrobacter sp.]|uniref:UrcA family protein n=1 Tax=Erythrobacter sp. TaxID=1042 RepID=UPI00311DC144
MKPLSYFVPLGLALLASGTATAQSSQPAEQRSPIIVVGKLHPSPDVIVRTVFIGDLDLKSAAGEAEMEKRVGGAIDDMCSIPSPLPLYGPLMEKPCRDEAWASARPQMDSAVRKAKSES